MKTKRILLTGGNGFLGTILKVQLRAKGYDIITLGRHSDNSIVCDLSINVPLLDSIDLVIHNAGKAHVLPRTTSDIEEFFSVNTQGTINLLTGLAKMQSPPEAIVFVSSVSVYGREEGSLVNEDQPLLATDPYGKSKIQAERHILEWCRNRSTKASIVRLPLIAAKNPPGNLGAMIKAMRRGYYFQVANGKARKSIVLAEDVANIIPTVANIGGIYNLTDGHHPSFDELERALLRQLGKKSLINIPGWIAFLLATLGDVLDFIAPHKSPVTSRKLKKITSTLTFDDTRARMALGWNPNRVIDANLV